LYPTNSQFENIMRVALIALIVQNLRGRFYTMEILCAERPCPNLGFSLNALGFRELGFGAQALVE
jgi:hypothetical protein